VVEEPIMYLLAPSLRRFVGWEWISDGYRLSFEMAKSHLEKASDPRPHVCGIISDWV
jgi:hypothetical protein